MVTKINKTFSENELTNFSKNYPERYHDLCFAIGDLEMDERPLVLNIQLPSETDKGCITVSLVNGNASEDIDVMYF